MKSHKILMSYLVATSISNDTVLWMISDDQSFPSKQYFHITTIHLNWALKTQVTALIYKLVVGMKIGRRYINLSAGVSIYSITLLSQHSQELK